MRLRATLPALLLAATAAHADAPSVDLKVEAGGEVDTNPQRIEINDSSASWREITPAAVARTAVRGALSWKPDSRRALNLDLLGAAKKYALGTVHAFSTDAAGVIQEADVPASGEDTFVVAADGRFDWGFPSAAAAATLRASYYDAFERHAASSSGDPSGDRDFRTGDAGVALTLVGNGDHRVSALAGYRLFHYKPNNAFDFGGPNAGLAYRHRFVLHRGGPAGDDHTLDLTLQYLANRRGFRGRATNNVCADGTDIKPECRQDSAELQRVDFFHAGTVDLVYTGPVIVGLRYEVHWNDSTSFGESLVRHRFEASGTFDLPADIFVTVRAVVQLNQFLDPLLLTGDIGTLVTIEDENRNALVVHAMRGFGRRFSLEARYAFYSNEFATSSLEFRRHTLYGGGVYAF